MFSSIIIEEDAIIGFYYGVDITIEEYSKRRKEGKGGYGLQISSGAVKDCREAFLENICLISAANSYVNLKHKSTGKETTIASLNAELIIYKGRPYLKSTRKIFPHEEILTKYSSSFGRMHP